METNVDDILAELRARAEKKLAEEAAPIPGPAAAEETAAVPEPAPAAEPQPVPAEDPVPAPAPVPAPPAAPEIEPEPELEKDIDELYVGSFVAPEYREDRSEKRRETQNRRAYVDKQSGKRKGFFAALLELIGFLLLVALTILSVLLFLQLIADVEIIPVDAIISDVSAWLKSFFG